LQNKLLFEFFEAHTLGLGQYAHDYDEADHRKNAIDQECSAVTDILQLPRKNQLHDKTDTRINQPDERNCQPADLVWKQFREQHPHHRTQGDCETRNETEYADEDQRRIHIDCIAYERGFMILVYLATDSGNHCLTKSNIAFKCLIDYWLQRLAADFLR